MLTQSHREEAERLLGLDERGQQIEMVAFALALHDFNIKKIRKYEELNYEFGRNILANTRNLDFYLPRPVTATESAPTEPQPEQNNE